MSINYKNLGIAKRKKKPKKEYALDIPPQDNIPKWVQELSVRNGIENCYYDYKNYHGETCFYVRRYEPYEMGKNTKKVLVPFSFDTNTNEWVKTSWKTDRPLFRENHLKRTQKPIIIFEGEKTTLAGNNLFKDHVSVCWSGGTNAIHQTNFSKLEDRKIILWPDNDKDGLKAMHHVAKVLIENEITEDINIIDLPNNLPTAWDVADPINLPGVTKEGILSTYHEYSPDNKIWKEIDKEYKEREADKAEYDLIDNYVYVRDRTDFFEINTYKFATQKQIIDWYAHVDRNMSNRLLENKDLKKVHSYLTHAGLPPGVIEIKPKQIPGVPPGVYLNNFKGSNIEPVEPVSEKDKNAVKEIIDYYRWLIPNWDIVEQIIAYIIRNPGRKIQYATIIVSKTEGAGKGLLSLVIQSMLGAENVEVNVSHSQMTGKHMTILEGKQLIILNEVLISGTGLEKKEITNKMKSLFTDPTIVIEPKGKPQMTIPNFCNFFIFSNDERALHLNRESRRYFVTFIKRTPEEIEKKLEKEKVKDKILHSIEGDGSSHLKWYFKHQVQIPDEKIFHSRAPITDDMLQMVQESRPDAIRMLDEALETNAPPFRNYHQWFSFAEMDGARNLVPQFSGMCIREELFLYLRNRREYQGLYLTLDLVGDWLKEKAIAWNDGNITRQISFYKNEAGDGKGYKKKITRPRAYLLKDLEVPEFNYPKNAKNAKPIITHKIKLSEMTDGQLGNHHLSFAYGEADLNMYKEYHDNLMEQSPNKDLVNKKVINNY